MRPAAVLPWRPAAGLALVFLFLALGHVVRDRWLLDTDGQWREALETLPWETELADSLQAEPPPRLSVPLSINTAPAESLILLPRVGPVLAGRIVSARREGSIFHNAAELTSVKGIGPRLAARLDTLLSYRIPHKADS